MLLGRWSHLLADADLAQVESMLRACRTWALVDPLSIELAGPLAQRLAEGPATLDRWSVDQDFWVRRAALLSLLPGLRAGRGDFARFGEYADRMLDEREFFIRKAIGWVLRETGKRDPASVIAWLTPRVSRASGVTLREAVKYLPPKAAVELRAAAGLRVPRAI